VFVEAMIGVGTGVGTGGCLLALRVIRVTMIVPITPISAAIIDGSIFLEDEFSGIFPPT
jgi:hypothetical protein